MAQETLEESTYSVRLTEAAVQKVTDLLRVETPGLALRISVQPGGCSGMRYQLYFADEYAKALTKMLAEREDEGFAEEDDEETTAQRAVMAREKESVVWFGRFAVVIDKKSGPYLSGAEIDYTDTLMKSGFTIDNPNAQGSCGCGDSFS
ncbi:iron-sulfur cluster assembly accessory protein [Streptomyces chartreusis]|jgi:Fe-S cluster assembly iron-binding protein IscA|uniref:HesB/IscA family protein n=1 Tax=Streptomyces chartreusis TaxID=1969 RepID=UPI002F91999D|nr:iron-sulfur cluster assembly accessory protein [Streptomyces chartreusis]WSZ73449.1 iron-sulfur cluster assembly accessory protein [Streptomyces chartreusis]WTA33299.1 iron-sulfur cluster assembly accessory protein [Streptomyces chartreusis]WTA33705.1 iron-sulfur cluster assembly accessory protein [Streptomyces chartreusis]